MQKYILRLSALLAGVALLAACGGGGSSASLGGSDVAVVGNTHITQAQYAALLAQAKLAFAQNRRAFPKQGTTAYEAVKTQVINLLVQQAEQQEKAAAEGITITDQQITNRLNAIKKQYFGGSEKKYQAALKAQKLTEAQVHQQIKLQLIQTALENKATTGVTVSNSDIDAYYKQHASEYKSAKSRDVRYILVKDQKTAGQLYDQLKSGNKQTWCTLAKKYSLDPSSKNKCGQGSFAKGQTVAAFDTVLFSAPTNQVHAPIHDTQYGWFVIEPTSAIKPSSKTPESKVASSIRQTILQTRKTAAVDDFATKLTKSYCSGSKVKYQTGYAPSPDPCTVTSTNATTTG
jgi:SurA-like N-terminal domain/PPIC-type PPIASE domain